MEAQVIEGLKYEELHETLEVIGLPLWLAGKESACNAGDLGSIPGLGRSPGEGKATNSSILAWRIPWGCKELDTTERLHLT